MQVGIVSLLPEMFSALEAGITGRAIKQGLITIKQFNPRDEATDKHRTIDDKPYGGGAGMVMQAAPLAKSVNKAKKALCGDPKVIFVSPKGKRLNQAAIGQMAKLKSLIFVAGRYEGIDQRFIDHYVDETYSLGDYVISGGELAIMVIIDAIIRLLPNALGDERSALQDSFMQGILDHPHYTRPEQYEGMKAPAVLLSGDHRAIEQWRRKMALGYTWYYRPDLLSEIDLDEDDQYLLAQFKREYK